jgi:Family of unknown function (DUF6481)
MSKWRVTLSLSKAMIGPYQHYFIAAAIASLPNLKASFMPSFKPPTFQERATLAAQAKKAVLEKLRSKPPIDEATLAKRLEAGRIKDAAQLKAREDKRAALAAEKALKAERSTKNTASPVKTDSEQKSERDAKYAARKNRAGKRG